jgi:acetylornithine/succinyldiaminopimelate/putrescine aminotransferase
MPDVRHIQFGHLADLENISSRTAAVFIEPVQGEAGVRTAPPAYFQQLKERCQQTGTLLVFDEIQTGLGRTGSFWAYEAMGVLPDILVSAKALGGGLPLGAFMARREIMQVLKNQPVLGHISTFGGNPLSTAAALATISVLNRDGLPGQAEEKGRLFVRHLVHPAIKEVRQKGLLLAVEFESFDLLLKIIHAAVAKGLITDWFLYCDNSLRIAPPLIITEGQIAEACALLLEAIDETV